MVCCRIFTDVLMANLFASLCESYTNRPRDVSIALLEEYLGFLSERFPVYVTSDFSEQAVKDCVSEYPELYKLVDCDDGSLVVRFGGLKPNLNYFNRIFSESISTHIRRMTKLFLEQIKKKEG